MGTRGFRLIRFRGRYYRFYCSMDSYPDGLGDSIVHSIPEDPAGYDTWLAAQRQRALEWDSAVEQALCVPRRNSSAEDNHLWNYDISDSGSNSLPYYMSEMNDLFIEWVYVVDLDREIFTVDHGAHFHLNRVPVNEWADALAQDEYGHRCLLPDLVPQESIAGLDLPPPVVDQGFLDTYKELNVRVVKPRGIEGFPPNKRHGPILFARIFQTFQRTHKIPLACLLRGWRPDELQFREIAYAIVCLASGSQHTSLASTKDLKENEEGRYAQLLPDGRNGADSEFVAQLGSGCHVEGNPQGSAPKTSLYWFDNALICVAARLDTPGIAEENIVKVVQYCHRLSVKTPVNAVIISIEHLVLVKVSNDVVERTDLLPLFNFQVRPSMDPRARYSELELAEMHSEHANRDEPLHDSVFDEAQKFKNALCDTDTKVTEPSF